MIGVIDYGMGNLRSVENALRALGHDCVITGDPAQLAVCEKLILPGVGAFKNCMKNIHEAGLYEPIKKMVNEDKKPLLGICLGMQVMFESGEENGYTEGFGFLKGRIVKMEAEHLRIPHIGWNQLKQAEPNPIHQQLGHDPYVYFVHSYYAQEYDPAQLWGYCEYGPLKVPGMVAADHVLGCQFHPEKSGPDGLKILQYYVEEFG